MKSELDEEWKELIHKAKKLGITKEEIRKFLQQAQDLQEHDSRLFPQ